jgi:diguanylate cyclase (GGDEF)-like protein/PAS domain S-box-containing protein
MPQPEPQPASTTDPVWGVRARLWGACGLAALSGLAAVGLATQQGSSDLATQQPLIIAVWLFLALLLATALAIEPAVRALSRQQGLLNEQSEHLERLAVVAQLTGNGVVITGDDGRAVWVNDGFTRLFGYTLEEAVGRYPTQLLGSEHADRATVAAIQAARAEGRPFDGRLLCRGKDGVNRWIDLDLRPLRGADGRVRGAVAVGTDITALVREQQSLSATLSSVATGVVIFDQQGHVIGSNAAAQAILARSQSEMHSGSHQRLPWSVVDDHGQPVAAAELPSARVLREGVAQRQVSLGIVTPTGELRWLLINAEPLLDAAGQVERVICSFADVTDLRNQRQVLAATVDGAGLGLWEWDLRTDATSMNERLVRMLGYAPGEIAPTREALLGLLHPEDREAFLLAVQAHLKDAANPCRQQLRMRRPDGEWAWTTASGTVVERNALGRPLRMAGVLVDMTEHMQMQAMLMHTARTDALTQLPNRVQLMERLDSAVARWRDSPSRRFALLYMDFDRFKLVNDTHGHEMGDALLRQIAERLVGALRRRETGPNPSATTATAARLGGDEFVVLLEGIDGLPTAQAVGERLLQALSDPYALAPGLRVSSSASVGIVSCEQCTADIDAHGVLRDADTAMYEAKRAGRSRVVVFDPSMHQAVTRRVALEADLRLALSQGQIKPAYQPVVDLTSGLATGVEALARWQHPTRGAVSPAEFIPVAEDSGLISALGLCMLSTACRDFVGWQQALGPAAPRTLAVNLSRAQLDDEALVEDVRAVIEATGIAPGCLQLEVTESLAGQEASVQQALHRLKALGLTLALDDFGTGYSSLACLHLLPIDTVKLDRSFVRDAQSHNVQRVLIRATVQVAEALGMTTVAEGVETDGQSDLVRELGCRRAQGYLFSKPLFDDELQAWLEDRQIRQAA